MSRLSLALRIARRTSARSKARSALIITMIALPIAGMSAVAVVGASMTPTAEETVSTKLGKTQALIEVVGTPADGIRQVPDRPKDFEWTAVSETTGYVQATRDEVFAGLDYRVIATYPTAVRATTATGFGIFAAVEGAVWDPSFAGRFDVIEGRGPTSNNEVMVTSATLDRLGLQVGDSVELSTTRATIVGTIDDQARPDSEQVFFGRTGAFAALDIADRSQNTIFYVPAEPLDWVDVKELNARGALVLSREVVLNPPAPAADIMRARDNEVPVSLFAIAGMIGIFAAFEVVLLAGAAFTVTARQQQRTLATIASVGATASTLRSVVTASGLVLGAIGGLVGAAIGVGAGITFMALTNDGSRVQYFGLHVPWPLLLAVAVFAILVGWLAALAPARLAAKVDVVAALRGSRRPPVTSARRPVAGLVFLLGGVGLTVVGGVLMSLQVTAEESAFATDGVLNWLPPTTLAAGPVLALIGLIACGPLVLRGLARLLQSGPIGARLSSRDAARNPGRSVPAIAVTMTTVFIAVVAMNLVASVEAFSAGNWNHRTVEGQIESSLNNRYNYTGLDEEFIEYDIDAVEQAVRSSVDVDDLTILSSAPEPVQIDRAEAAPTDSATHPFVAIPPENACDDLEFDVEDWRCQSNFVDPGNSGMRDRITVGDAAGLALLLGHTPSGAALNTLANGGVVSLYPHPVADGKITIDWWTSEQVYNGDHYLRATEPKRSVAVPAIVEQPEYPIEFGVYMTPATAAELNIDTQPSLLLASTKTPITPEQEDALMFAVEAAKPGIATGEGGAFISRGPEPIAQAWAWGLLALSGIIALAAASVAIGLARFDGRQDDATLASLGAARLVRRNFAFWQGLVLVGTGAVLGAALGIVPAIALSQNDVTPFVPAWPQIALVVVVLPMLIAVGSWLVAGRGVWTLRVAGE